MVRKATIEKLINKILKQYTFDLAWIMPFVLMLLLLFRETSSDKQNTCNPMVAKWLFIYFLSDIVFANTKLFKICILKSECSMRSYFFFWLITGLFYYTFMFLWFSYGTMVLYRSSVYCP